MGPTASGKSQLAMALAGRLPAEIVSVDSAQVYRGMDIGTAKPPAADRRRVPHHLIDIVDPTEAYSAARFRADALPLVAAIAGRGRVPLLVGGTMLYFKALRDGLSALPAADAALRAQIEAEAARRGWPALHAELARVDPASAARIQPSDPQRIQRALEVCRLAGRPMSELIRGERSADAPLDIVWIALVPSDRAVLHRRIAERFDAMLAAGLVAELAALRSRYALSPDLPSMRCVGYRQAWEHLDGRISRDELRDRGIFATRQLAKRQLTWLRSWPGATRLDALAPDVATRAWEAIAARP
ncbi:MAG: tRNA (adenosine(37)-N6)-dimethylallyltransferase MiaA [Burkholderiales bacterium]|nr:tRNA (adenosine(37)-N6)-dimethylallyltransferase MiaA [Burkholderiales bacterium]